MKSFKETQYNELFELEKSKGITKLGLMSSGVWQGDPKRLVFLTSRYKFVSRMLEGKNQVLELGCSDAFASRIVKQTVKNLTVSDFDPVFLDYARAAADPDWPMQYLQHDMIAGPTPQRYEAIYALDVFEHIDKQHSDAFVSNIIRSLDKDGVMILGIPSLESQAYASPASKAGHVNCLSGNDFKSFLSGYFTNIFMFSMNDEVVHTGFFPMAHYLLAICTNARLKS